MEPGQHFVWERFFFFFETKHLIFKYMLCRLSAIQWSLVFLEMVLYSGFSMRTRGRMQWCFLLVPETTPKITLIIHLSCLLFWERERQWRGEGKNWGMKRGWVAAVTGTSKTSWQTQTGWIGALSAFLPGLGQQWWRSVSLWRVPFLVG